MSSAPRRKLTCQEYLAIERAAAEKSILYRGEMYSMSGVNRAHSLICSNLTAAIHQRIVERDCEVHAHDLRVKNQPTNSYFYPDVVAFCTEPKFEDKQLDTLTNPQVVIEVLSESTEHFDRAGKFEDYQLLNSLQEYILVAQDRVRVEIFRKQGDSSWNYVSMSQLSAVLHLASVDVEIPLNEIYAKVQFVDGDSTGLKVIEEKAAFMPR